MKYWSTKESSTRMKILSRYRPNLEGTGIRDSDGSTRLTKISPLALDLADNLHSLCNLSKYSVLSVQPWGGGSANEDWDEPFGQVFRSFPFTSENLSRSGK